MAPIDKYGDDDEEKADALARKSSFKEFECPGCNANNPCDPPFAPGDEVLCNYCGAEFLVRVTEGGKVKLREI